MKNDPRQLLERHFDTAFAAPDGIKKLRELILTLAMQGKLVNQDPNDPPASKLLEEIEAEKKRFTRKLEGAKGKIKKKTKPLPDIKPQEMPYELPQGWEWVQLGGVISHMDAGWSPSCESEPANDSQWGVLKTTAVQPLRFWPHENKALPSNLTPRPEAQVAENDILITRAGPRNRVGICCVAKSVRPYLMLSDKIIRFKIFGDLIFSDFCALSLNAGFGADQIESMKSGMADSQMNISQEKVRKIIISLPPLPEQHRIVDKIEQLMASCDELEKLRTEREQLRLTVHTAAVQELLDTEEQDGHTHAWQFLTQHFDDLYTVKENVSELRKAILQLAVKGKLSSQNQEDEPVEALLSRVQKERHKLKLRKSTEPINTSTPLGYEIPQNWRWQRLDDLLVFGPTNGLSPRAVEYETKVRSLTLSATTSGKFKSEHSKFIDIEIPEDSELWLREGDLLVQRGNTIEYVGVPAVYHGKPGIFIHPDLMMKLRISRLIDIDYIFYAMSSEQCRDYLRSHASGTSGTMPKINQKTLKSLPLPVPPRNEQLRIVAEINQLMSLCDQLELLIESATCKKTELLNSVIAQA